MWQMFVDFRKVYDIIHRNSLYNIIGEFGFPKKLINITKLSMEGVKYQVRVEVLCEKRLMGCCSPV